MGQAHLALGQLQEAASYEQRVLGLTEYNGKDELRAEALVVLADIERQEQGGDLALAANLYNEALGLDPDQYDAALGLGLVDVARGDWGTALSTFERALSLAGPENAMAHFWYAEALLRQDTPQMLSRAMQHYERALALRPVFPEARLGIAQAQYNLDNADAAMATVDHALEQRPNYAEGWLFKGILLQDSGETAEALEAYTSAIEAGGNLGEAYYRRGLIHMQQLRHEDAAQDLQRAVELQPANPEFQYWLGQASFALNRVDQALSAFQRAVELRDGIYPAAQFHQALAEEATGQMEAARDSLEALVQTAGNNEWVNRASVELERLTEE
jgi:tetratricopeptide (TPR) repeat protein